MLSKLNSALLCATLLAGVPVLGASAAANPFATVKIIGAAEAARPVTFDVVLPLRNKDQLDTLLAQLHDESSPLYHHWLTPKEFGLRFGPDSATVARVAAALQARGFTVEPHTRTLHVHGTAAQVQSAFGARLSLAQGVDGHIHAATQDTLRLPKELTDAGAQVFSFIPHSMHTNFTRTGVVSPLNRYSPTGSYWYDDLKQAYGYPAYTATATVKGSTIPLNGTGVTIGALMSSDILPTDIAAVFDHEGFSTTTGTPDPTITTVDIDGGGGTDSDAFFEASLDTQEEITSAPGANVILYSIPSLSDGDVFNGYVTIVEDDAVDMVSSSFGGCELGYFPSYNGGQDYRGVLLALHELFLQGNAQGITFLASSGDEAGRACPSVSYFTTGIGHYVPSVEEPADDPAVTAVGGTNVITGYNQGSLDSIYVGENAWDDPWDQTDPYGFGGHVTGSTWGATGGYSRMWPQPSYQAAVTTGSTTARAVPDVGMQVGGCPGGATDYNAKKNECTGGKNPLNGNGNTQRSAVVVAVAVGQGGNYYGVIGTSVSSPEFTGAMAPLVALKGRMGNLNTYLYKKAAAQAAGTGTYFHTNIPGYNAVELTDLNSTYSLSAGVGTPIVANLLGVPKVPLAGTPQSASNP